MQNPNEDNIINEENFNQVENTKEPSGKVSKWKTGWRKELLDWVEAIAVAVVVALVLRTFVMTLALVEGASMENTLNHGDRLYVNKLMYTPEKGDIVIVDTERHPQGPLVKRVIATEGDTIYIDPFTNLVYVNDELIEEDYIKGKTVLHGLMFYTSHNIDPTKYSRENPIVLGEDEVFVMGDNRENSSDSRNLGIFTEDEIMGHAVFRFWPIGNIGLLD